MNRIIILLILAVFISPSCKTNINKKQTAMNKETKNDAASITLEAVEKFNAAFNKHDVDAVMATMTEDCIFENTNPQPDGTRLVGAEAVGAYWKKFFTSNPDAFFEAEDIFASGDRCVVRWIYRKTKDGKPWHLRGVDVFKVRDGKVAEKLAYVKG
jgi:ketosteroid isomerase-like protein